MYHIFGVGDKGLPDLVAYRALEIAGAPSQSFCQALFIEVKGKGGTLSKWQKDFREYAKSMDIPVHVCYDWEQVKRIIEEHG